MYVPVVAVHNKILRKVGFDQADSDLTPKSEDVDERLKPGDTLLMETYPNFVKSYADSGNLRR